MPFKIQDFHEGDTVRIVCHCRSHRIYAGELGVVVAFVRAGGYLNYDIMYLCLDHKRKDRKRAFPPPGVFVPSDECLALYSHKCDVEFITSEQMIYLKEPI